MIFGIFDGGVDDVASLVSQRIVFVHAAHRMSTLAAWHTPVGAAGGVTGNLNLYGR